MRTAQPYYHALEQTSALMVAAARQQDWAEVQRLEVVADSQITLLRMQRALPPTTPQERNARLQALKAVLRHDALVRQLAEPSLVRLDGLLYRNSV